MTDYRIHPAIGIARVGNSDAGHYIAPESWQTDYVPPGGYRDADHKIKRMGCRFRIYEFVDNEPVREITAEHAIIEWEVHLVNKKAAKDVPVSTPGGPRMAPLNPGLLAADLTIDPGPQGVTGIKQNVKCWGAIGPSGESKNVKLGNLVTDRKGRLIVLGGHGRAESWGSSRLPKDWVQNPDWFDDTSDGPVRAHITFPGGVEFDAESAWVLVGPPDFAHPVVNLVTLYDVVVDTSAQVPNLPILPVTVPSFERDIYPVLHRAAHMQWTLMSTEAGTYGRCAMHGHGITGDFDMHDAVEHDRVEDALRLGGDFLNPVFFQKLHEKTSDNQVWRENIFKMLKDPNPGGIVDIVNTGEPNTMPPLEHLTLTPTQYEKFRRWSLDSPDNFDDDWDTTWDPVAPPQPTFSNIPLKDRPTVLDRAALDGGVGGSFEPGIEADWKIAEAATYQRPRPSIQAGSILPIPFRISSTMAPGHLTEGLSVPWQADFNLCTGNWWPGARPVLVTVDPGGSRTTGLWTRDYTDESVRMRPRPILEDFTDKNKYDKANSKYKEALYANQKMELNQEMVDHWHELGFIAPDPSVPAPWYIETERIEALIS